MRSPRILLAGLVAALALLAVPVGAASARPAPGELHPQTRENLLAGMQGEAYAYATYDAYGQVAGQRPLAALFDRTARYELDKHFAAFSRLYGLAGSNAANLQDAASGEDYEATTMYPTFAREAAAAGDQQAADLFTEIAGDEATHRDWFLQALEAITTGGTIPAGPQIEPIAIVAGPSQVSPQTRANLLTAMHGESFAHAKYLAYAQKARASGLPAVAALFERTSQVELREHFAEEANLAGLAGSDRANLQDSIAGETNEATVVYPTDADQAFAVGDRHAGKLFERTARDEARHAASFTAALDRLPPA